MKKLSVILPSIDPSKWINLYQMIQKSVGEHSFEVIACGPLFPSIELQVAANFRYIREFSCPSRAFMVAANVADAEYITWFPDDCIIIENTLKECIDLLDSKTKNDGLTILYSEGPNFSGNQHLESERWY